MCIFSAFPPMPEEAILDIFRDFTIMAAQTDRVEYWAVAEQVYRALRMEASAHTHHLVLLHASEADQTDEDMQTAVFQALRVVNQLSEAAEAWWNCFARHLFIAQACTRKRGEAIAWVIPLMRLAGKRANAS